MPRKFQFEFDEFYHVYNRGTDKRDLFSNDIDRNRFARLLYLCNSTKPLHYSLIPKDVPLESCDRGQLLVNIGAYCLMNNHFHILLSQKVEDGVSFFMQKLTTAYTMYFNIKNKRTGTLLEGTFKAKPVDSDAYLHYLFAYIHLNPVKYVEPKWKTQGIKDLPKVKQYLGKYDYSSYLDYLGVQRNEDAILSRQEFPEYFDTIREFDDFISEWLEYNEYDD